MAKKPPQQESVLLCTAGYDHTVRFWEAPTALCWRNLQFGDSQVNALAISPNKGQLAVAGNPKVALYDINSQNAQPVLVLDDHKDSVMSVGFQKDNKWLFTGSVDGTVKIWDTRAKGCQRNIELPATDPAKTGATGGKCAVNSAVLHPNQGEIFTGDAHGYIRVWDLAGDKCSTEIRPTSTGIPVRSVSIAADASLFVAANDAGTCYVYRQRASMPERFQTPPAEQEEQASDAEEAAHAGYKLTNKIPAHSTYCLKASLSPDGRYLATSSADKTVKVFNIENDFTHDKTLYGHQRWVWDVAFSADSAYLVTASSDMTAKLWELSSGEAILEYAGHNKAVTCVALDDVG